MTKLKPVWVECWFLEKKIKEKWYMVWIGDKQNDAVAQYAEHLKYFGEEERFNKLKLIHSFIDINKVRIIKL